MTIELTTEERDILVHLLDREISDLGPEVRRTRTSGYRDELKVRKQTLKELTGRLLHSQEK
ncbi:MAG: hypothetical protein ACYSUQ_15910 [Planctomycetota bacterium]|jgi:hypothetical protein